MEKDCKEWYERQQKGSGKKRKPKKQTGAGKKRKPKKQKGAGKQTGAGKKTNWKEKEIPKTDRGWFMVRNQRDIWLKDIMVQF